MEIQHSIEWFRKRLGNFTGSQIGLLMKKGKSDYFSDTAKTYIYQVASERDMNPEIINDDVEFEKYLNPEKPDVPLNKNDAFQKVQKRRVQEKR